MKWKTFLPLSFLLPTIFIVAGCESTKPGPYLYREGLDWRVEEKDRNKVMVCYNAKWTTPEAVRAVAAKGCGHVGLVPVFAYQDILACPVFLPARAHFNCVASTAPVQKAVPASGDGDDAGGVAIPEAPPELPPHLRPER